MHISEIRTQGLVTFRREHYLLSDWCALQWANEFHKAGSFAVFL